MKIKLSSSLQYCVAEHCAGTIHAHVVQMHLRRSWGIWEAAEEACPYALHDYQREEIQAVRAAVRSIRDPYERRSFVLTLKFIFNKLCEEKGTARKWQDYIASVRAAHAEHEARKLKEAA